MPKVVISWRRKNRQYAANLIYDRLVEPFSQDSVYFDLDAIPAGVDPRRLRSGIGQALDSVDPKCTPIDMYKWASAAAEDQYGRWAAFEVCQSSE